jgi:hypothetical protein
MIACGSGEESGSGWVERKRERGEEQQEKAGVCMEDGGREISFKITG